MDTSLEEGDLQYDQALSTDTHVTLAETAPLEDTQEEIIIQTDDSENVYDASMADSTDLQGTVLHISDSDNMLDSANGIMGIKYENSVYLTDSSVDLAEPSVSSNPVPPMHIESSNLETPKLEDKGQLTQEEVPETSTHTPFILVNNSFLNPSEVTSGVCNNNQLGDTIIIAGDNSCQTLIIPSTSTKEEKEAAEEEVQIVFVNGDGSIVPVNEDGSVPEAIITETVITSQQPHGVISASDTTNSAHNTMAPPPLPRLDPDAFRESSIREKTKREMDRRQKKIRRLDPVYREMEREKSKARMKARRNDPAFRELEREKDRLRRKRVRLSNKEQREKEKERDRLYKRNKHLLEKHMDNCDRSLGLESMDVTSDFDMVVNEVEIGDVNVT